MNFVKLRKDFFDPLAWYLSKREIHKLMEIGDDIPQVICQMRNYRGRGWYASIQPHQKNSEFAKLLYVTRDLEPKIIVEIGTDKGGTLFGFCRSLNHVEKIISIDLQGGKFGGGYLPRRKKLYHEFIHNKPGTQIHLMQSDSHQVSTLEKLLRLLDGKLIDFLFIDGDHTYNGVKQDFEMYRFLVRSGGIISFHDIITGDKNHEVYRFWREIRNQFEHREFIENPLGSMGIGILYV